MFVSYYLYGRGLLENRGNDQKQNVPEFISNLSGETSRVKAPRKLKPNDTVAIFIDLNVGTMIMTIRGADGDFAHCFGSNMSLPETVTNSNVGPRGDPAEFIGGITFGE